MSFKPLLNKITGLNAATAGCLFGSAASIALAFMQADRASKAVATPPGYALAVCGAALLGFCAVRAMIRRRWISVLLHGGCVLVGVGWLVGQYVAKHPADGLPVYGAVAMIDGDESNTLYTGDNDCAGCQPPTNLAGEYQWTNEGFGTMLTWSYDEEPQSFKVYRSEDGTNYELVATVRRLLLSGDRLPQLLRIHSSLG